MADVALNEAVVKAKSFAAKMLDERRTNDILLEEIERKGAFWVITLSTPKVVENGTAPRQRGKPGDRDYKTYQVRCSDGEVVSMKIRELSYTG